MKFNLLRTSTTKTEEVEINSLEELLKFIKDLDGYGIIMDTSWREEEPHDFNIEIYDDHRE